MKGKLFAHRRWLSVAVCFAIMFSMMANFGLFQAIADAVTKKSFYVDFAALADNIDASAECPFGEKRGRIARH